MLATENVGTAECACKPESVPFWNTPVYHAWQKMIQRCTNPKNHRYAKYGAMGIKVCERWMKSFQNFSEDMGPRPSSAHSLDRYPDPFGNYEPSNCRWATAKEQGNNRRDNRILEYNGQRKTMSEWASHLGWSPKKLNSRLRNGWSIERALSTP